jgi:hypothetical protein
MAHGTKAKPLAALARTAETDDANRHHRIFG